MLWERCWPLVGWDQLRVDLGDATVKPQVSMFLWMLWLPALWQWQQTASVTDFQAFHCSVTGSDFHSQKKKKINYAQSEGRVRLRDVNWNRCPLVSGLCLGLRKLYGLEHLGFLSHGCIVELKNYAFRVISVYTPSPHQTLPRLFFGHPEICFIMLSAADALLCYKTQWKHLLP